MAPTLCFSTLGCTDAELEDVLALARAHGLKAVELRGLGRTLDLPGYFETRFANPGRLAGCFADYGVWPASMDASASLVGAGRAERAELDALLPWARASETGQIRVFDGGTTGSDGELESMAPLLDWWAEKGTQLALAIETHDCLAQPSVLQRFVSLYPQARLLWDTHHTWHVGHELPSTTWTKLRGRTTHLHVKDSVKSSDRRTYVPPGAGTFPHRDLIAALSGEPVVISLEWERHWYPEIGPIEPALAAFVGLYSTPVSERTA